MTDFISKEDVSKALRLEKVKLKLLAPAIMKLLKLDNINDAYFNAKEKTGAAFAKDILDEFGVTYEVSDTDLANIPKTEPFILISNHPYGGIDGIILLSIISKIRPDYKMVANYLLKQILPLADCLIAVNPFENVEDRAMNIAGVKQILEHIKTSPLGIFPAGEVSSMKLNNLKISDKKWEPAVGRIIAKAGVKVIPVYFSGHNSLAFNLMGLLHPNLRTIKLPSEMLNKGKSNIKLRIGKPIPFKELANYESDQLLDFLRAKTYALGATEETHKKIKFNLNLRKLSKPEELIDAVNPSYMAQEIEEIRQKSFLFEHDMYEVFIASYKEIPNVMREISRLREIVFRSVGEGTNHSCDTDEYDVYYKHLFIWDREAKKLVGSYRLGEGDVLFKKFGVKGFYLNQLFKMSKEMHPMLFHSIELGRSFVSLEYQKKPASLMLLWKGIHVYIKANKERFLYMIGPVSISNSFSNLSKDLLVSYIRHNHWDNQIAKWIEPKKRFHYQSKTEGKNLLLQKHSADIKLLDNFIGEIEGNQKLKMPILVKKYLKLNGKIVSFNVDPNFNDSLDGFLIVEVKGIPEEAFDMVSR
ncbi:MAG: lysophospholipid acyltransferase family protein [bacterium]|nr:lysophospholipid acyltransferase family protein [bacterium]